MWLGIGVGSPLLGWWSDAIGSRKIPLVFSSAIGFVSFLILMQMPSLPLVVIGILIFLAGSACSGQVLSFAVVKENNMAVNHASAIGFNNMAVVIAGLIFQPLIGELIDYHSGVKSLQGVIQYSAADYHFGVNIIPFVYLAGMLISLFLIRETHCKQRR